MPHQGAQPSSQSVGAVSTGFLDFQYVNEHAPPPCMLIFDSSSPPLLLLLRLLQVLNGVRKSLGAVSTGFLDLEKEAGKERVAENL